MLNKELFNDPRDAKIARLKMCIERFKEYDKKRKVFYAEKMKRLGELESYVEEIENAPSVDEYLRTKVERQKKEIATLHLKMQAAKIEDRWKEEDLKLIVDQDRLIRENARLKNENKRLATEISNVTTELLRIKGEL